jgi:hypothetical protein
MYTSVVARARAQKGHVKPLVFFSITICGQQQQAEQEEAGLAQQFIEIGCG